MLLLIPCVTFLFILFDIILNILHIEGRYYFNHFIANMIIVKNTLPYLINCYTHNMIEDIMEIEISKSIVYSIHIYHIIWYFNKLRFDDWLHHIIMVCIALPLTNLIDKLSLTGHCLFFINGLPGGIDYLLLFLIRNNILNKIVEKKINRILNLWIRCPGCIATSTLIIYNIVQYYHTMTYNMYYASLLIMVIVYWNGIYFMDKVVTDYALYKNSLIES